MVQSTNEQSRKRGRSVTRKDHGCHQCEGRRTRNQPPSCLMLSPLLAARGSVRATTGLSGVALRFTVWGVMMGLRMYSFIDLIVDGLNYVLSVTLRGAAFNPSWHLTPDGAGRSACADHVTDPAWLSFCR